MRNALIGALVAVFAASLVGCGGDSGSVVGTWTIDQEKMIDMGVAEAKKRAMANLEGKSEAEKKAAEAMMTPDVLRKGVEVMMKEIKVEFTLSADKTAKMSFQGMGKSEESTGTWEQSGDKVTVKETTKNGKPVESDKKPVEFTYKDGKLTAAMAPGGPTMTFKKK
jgi:hypothetical protein